MKKFIKYTVITICVLLLALFAAPFVFKTKIINAIKTATNKQLNATINFDEKNVSISFIRSFPKLSVGLENVSVVGKDTFNGDTLFGSKQLRLNINIMDAIKNKKINISRIYLQKPSINLQVLQNGKANWDIAKPSTDTTKTDTSGSIAFSLKEIEIENGNISYNDRSLNFTTSLKHVNHISEGDFTLDKSELKTNTTSNDFSLSYGGIPWINHVNTDINANIDMDLKNMKFGFKENNILLNALNIKGDGWVDVNENDIDMDIKFKALENTFKNFLSLIPGVYSQNFNSVKADGTLVLNGFLKGKVTDNSLPATNVDLKVNNANFQFPQLQYPVNNINIDVNYSNPNSNTDATVINVSKFNMNIANENIAGKLLLKTPVSDPYIDAFVKGKLDLNNIKNFIPLDKGTSLQGLVDADVTAIGNYSTVKNKNFGNLNAKGNISVENLLYQNAENKYNTSIKNLQLIFSPQKVNMTKCIGHIAKNDFDISGDLENFIAFIFNNETIKANVNFKSDYLNINSIMGDANSDAEPKPSDTNLLSVVEIPSNIDVNANADIKKLIYDNYIIADISGNAHLHESKIDMKNVKANMLGGNIVLDGTYDSKNAINPFTSLKTSVSKFNIGESVNYFTSIKKYAPIAKYINGLFNAEVDMSSILNQFMQPNYNSMNVKGSVSITDAFVKDLDILKQIGTLLKIKALENLNIKNQKFNFNINNGIFNLLDSIKIPFTNGAFIKLKGSSKLTSEINYGGNLFIPREAFGTANNVLEGYISQAAAKNWNLKVEKIIPVEIEITGTVLKPQVKLGLKGFKKAFVENLKDQAVEIGKNEANKKLAQLLAEAKKRADAIRAEAKKRADDLRAKNKEYADKLRQETDARTAQIKSETDTRIAQLRAEGAKKTQEIKDLAQKEVDAKVAQATDPIARIAAKKLGEKIMVEANKKADAMQNEYNKKVDAVKVESDKKIADINVEANKKISEKEEATNKEIQGIEDKANAEADKVMKEAEEKSKIR